MELENITEEEAHYILGNKVASVINYLKGEIKDNKGKNLMNQEIDNYYSIQKDIKKIHNIDFSPYETIIKGALAAKASQMLVELKQQNKYVKEYNEKIEELEKQQGYKGANLGFFD